MYTSVVLFIFKDLSNLKTLENYLQVEYHYPKCLEPNIMFQIFNSVFRFFKYLHMHFTLWMWPESKHGMHLFHTLYSVISSSFIYYLQCPWNSSVTCCMKWWNFPIMSCWQSTNSDSGAFQIMDFIIFVAVLFFQFRMGSHYAAMSGLVLTMQTRMALNS